MIPAPAALSCEGLSVRFGDRPALTDVDLQVHEGEFVALAGPNGSGKTTLIRAALGFLQPARGRVELFGTPVFGLPIAARARRVAWVPQDEVPRENVPVLDYVLYGRFAHWGRWDGETSEDRRAAQRALAELDLAERASDGILSLSGGERQRALLARALVQESPLLLLDEPTAHLDIGYQLDLLERVRALGRRRGVTVVAALHDLNLAARFADRIVVLSRGRLVADGPPGEVLSEELLIRVWGVVAALRRDPSTGAPYLVPHRLATSVASVPSLAPKPRVHVVGGGGSASPMLRALVDDGYRVTAGALHLLDSDAETAESLGVPAALEVPFAPLSAETRARHRELLESADAIVVAPFAVGPSNLANLEDLSPWTRARPILLLRPDPSRRWDFVDGRAERSRRQLLEGGAEEVEDVAAMLRRLRERLSAPNH
jgi:iron complex transport system ATP-binding protein